jgi:hypothetical protein
MTILFGSQSGTAENFAYELGKEVCARGVVAGDISAPRQAKKYHFNAKVYDLEEYDHVSSASPPPRPCSRDCWLARVQETSLPEEKFVVLLLATFGEGEPTGAATPRQVCPVLSACACYLLLAQTAPCGSTSGPCPRTATAQRSTASSTRCVYRGRTRCAR